MQRQKSNYLVIPHLNGLLPLEVVLEVPHGAAVHVLADVGEVGGGAGDVGVVGGRVALVGPTLGINISRDNEVTRSI